MLILKLMLVVFSCGQQLYNSLRRSVCRSVRRSVRLSVSPSNNVKKVDSSPKNHPILMYHSSLEAYGQVL